MRTVENGKRTTSKPKLDIGYEYWSRYSGRIDEELLNFYPRCAWILATDEAV
jgi:hypothetical protein